jgi:hypothetical protein
MEGFRQSRGQPADQVKTGGSTFRIRPATRPQLIDQAAARPMMAAAQVSESTPTS